MSEAFKNLREWPQDALQRVPACPACGSNDRRKSHAEMTDRVFGTAPGEWTLFDCRRCGSAWLDPRPDDASLGQAYAGYFTHSAPEDRVIVRPKGLLRRALHSIVNGYLASRYGVLRAPRRAGWLLHFVPPLRAACDDMCRHLPKPNPGQRLLDVGCGNGGFLVLAKEMGWEAEGLDFDAGAAVMARSLGFSVTVGGIDALAGHVNTFDAITSSHVLEHVTDPGAHLRTLYSLLKPGGVLWLQTPNIESKGAKMYGRDWRDLDPPRHLVLFNSTSLRRLLAAAGFVDARDKPEFGNALVVLRASEAIKQGLPVEGSSGNKSRLPMELLVECVEWFAPSSREFLTVMCRKPEA